MIEGWEVLKYNDVASVQQGYAFKSGDFSDHFGVPVIKIKNVASGALDMSDVQYYPRDIASLERFIIENDHILIAMTGSHVSQPSSMAGRVVKYSAKENALLNQRLGRLYSKKPDRLFDDFLYHFMRQYEITVDLCSNAGGSANQANISSTQIKDLEIEVPASLIEQKAIAEVLSSLDDKIDLLHRQNATLEALAETLFRQYFIEEALEDWPTERLGSYVKVHRGLSYNGSGLTDEGDGIPMHNLNSIYEGGQYKHDGIKFYNGEYRDRHKVSAGDVIVANTEQGHDLLLIGSAARVPDSFGHEGIFSQHLYKIEVRKLLTNEFLYFLLKSLEVRNQIQSATNGSTVNMLPADGIEWAEFRVPPVEKIENFTVIVADLLTRKDRLYVEIKTLEKIRNTLLPKLMSGEVRVAFDREAV